MGWFSGVGGVLKFGQNPGRGARFDQNPKGDVCPFLARIWKT